MRELELVIETGRLEGETRVREGVEKGRVERAKIRASKN